MSSAEMTAVNKKNFFVIFGEKDAQIMKLEKEVQLLHRLRKENIHTDAQPIKHTTDKEMKILIEKEAEIEHLKFQVEQLKNAYLDIPTQYEQNIIFDNVLTKKQRDEQIMKIRQQHLNDKLNKKLENDKDEQLYQKVQKYMGMNKKNQRKEELIKLYRADPNNDKYCSDLANFFLEGEYKDIY